jgi:Flp pilus assembly protein TadG
VEEGLVSLTQKFFLDRDGNFAIMFSFLALPLLLSVGMAVDYANLLRVQDELQASADSAVLAVAGRGDTISDAQADIIGDGFLDTNFDPQYSNLNVIRSGPNVEVVAKTRVKLAFGGLFGVSFVDIDAKATSELANSTYEIALSLDTTGSMAGGKLQSMKDAVEVMVDSMAAQNPNVGSLKFSVVPFSNMVNVGPQFGPTYSKTSVTQQPANWLDVMGDSPIAQNDLDTEVSRFALYKHLGVTWRGCVESRGLFGGVDYGTSDVAPRTSDPRTLFVPSFASDEKTFGSYPNSYLVDFSNSIGTSTPAARLDRYGASADDAFKAMTFSQQIAASASWQDRNPDFSNQTYYSGYAVAKGPNFGCDSQPILPLTTNFGAVKAKVNSLVALGSTNILEGAIWGWRTLSSTVPFTEGAPEGKVGVQKILVLLTDGTNNLGLINNSLGSAYSSFGYLVDGRMGMNSGSASQVTDALNDKTIEACNNAKASGIEIYTIRLEEPNITTGNMLLDCASGADHYLDVPNRALLDEAFAKIAKKIVRIRLAS